MGNPVVSNVLKTGAVLWVAPVGEAGPDETSVGFGDAWGGNWARVGYTLAPLALKYESTEHDVKVEEHLAAILRRRIEESAALETVLAEFTAEYLQLAAGDQDTVTTTPAGATQRGYEETGLGDEVILAEYKWGFEGMYVTSGGDLLPLRLFVHKATAKVNGDLSFSKKDTETPGIPIHIAALCDPTQAAGQRVILWQRVTAVATGS